MLSKKTYQDVLDRMNILEVFGWYDIKPHKLGAEYKCVCPFHADKNASLSINTDKNVWKCFGCDKGGSAIDFVMEKENHCCPIKIK